MRKLITTVFNRDWHHSNHHVMMMMINRMTIKKHISKITQPFISETHCKRNFHASSSITLNEKSIPNNPYSPKYNIVIVDIEGTSTNVGMCRIIEVAGARIIDGTSVSSFTSLVNADIPFLPEPIVEITKITKAMLDLAPPPQIVMSQLYSFLSSQPSLLVGHNVRFDVSVIFNEFVRHKLINADSSLSQVYNDFSEHPLFANTLCTLKLARRVFPGQPDYKLGSLIENLGLGRVSMAHRAHADVSMTSALWRKIYRECYDRMGGDVVPDHDFFLKLQETPAKSVDKFIEMYKLEKAYSK
ncbi:hypothetical protein C9374_012001 [Naegleria lovaniensis]|uniref:Exonuclease domain-containing protein n=1 Tax=Naegleria lovaniensis TaxID=51637 RepID=A0AA88GDX8_NAELO|nr:uncharacterized protein C9374_012001 [Naegleria lovaniensis]KAG2373538.1 hypothetical protein C9374_012001 [Naegleria lovaniensis]